MICYYYDAPKYFFFLNDVPDLLYYSHFTAIFLALAVGLFVFLNNRTTLLNKLLFTISMTFAAIAVINLITWTHNDSRIITYAWSLLGALQAIISILAVYLMYVFATGTDVSYRIKLIFTVLIAPALLFGATNLNLSGFDLAWCDAFQFEGGLYNSYYNFLGVLVMVWVGYIMIKHYPASDSNKQKQHLLLGVGIELFLLLFFSIFYLADFLTTFEFVEDSRLELYGFFGMSLFMVLIGVLIVQFKTFNIGAHIVEALTIALLLLVASQYTYANTTTTTLILTTVTLTLTAIASAILVRSVRKEIKQREEIEGLAKKLAKANKRLRELDKLKSEFVSIASHQLRSPLTAIRGYASMLLEGSYGKLSQKASKAVERIEESSADMAASVEDYLNVSRIESGNMKYELVDFNLKDEASRVADDKRQEAMKHGLLLTFKSKVEGHSIVNADIGKVRQILHNLINNAVKYTPKGSIKVQVTDDLKAKKIRVDVVDTGIGMKEDELESVFEKFQRAHNANDVNVTGTGLGLFVAQKMATEMGGSISASSAGPGQGSTFTLELPLQM